MGDFSKLTPEKIERNTYWSNQYAKEIRENLNQYDTDSRKEDRMKKKHCKTCFYLRKGFAGQAFTEYTCRNCGGMHMHHNTAVPKYCDSCAVEHEVCKQCGASLHDD